MHLLVVIVIVVLVNLGIWQLNRLDERQTQNKLFENRSEQVLTVLEAQNMLSQPEFEAEDLEFTGIRLSGQFVNLNRESIVRQRTSMGRPGVWMLTPFEDTLSGDIFIINRGWVPRELSSPECSNPDGEESPEVASPSGEVELVGILRLPEGKDTSITSSTKCLSRVILNGYEDLTSFPFWIQLEEYSNFANTIQPLPSPDRGNGPHFSYAVQWFIFALLVVIIYPLILRKNERKHESSNPNQSNAS